MPDIARVRRRFTLATAVLSMFILGAVYAYGVLLRDIMMDQGWDRSTAALPQAVLLFVYAIGMGVGGALLDRTDPTRIAMIGGALFGVGLIGAGLTESLLWLIISYGVVGGIGFGFAYVASVTAAMKTFPTRRGLAAGMVVGAFGLGAVVWAPLAQYRIADLGWQGELLTFGVFALFLLPILGFGIRAPWRPHDIPGEHPEIQGCTLGDALRQQLFWLVFAAYFFVTAAGLLWLNHYQVYGVSQGIPPAGAALLVAITAIGSSIGRFLMGGLSDRIGRFPSLIGAAAVGMLVLVFLAFTLPTAFIFVLAGVLGFAFGTWLSLYGPTATDLFGLRSAGAIYGALYLSYGLGGLIGPTLGGYLADLTGDYQLAFLIAAGFCALGTILYYVAMQRTAVDYLHPPAADEAFPV